MLGFNPSPAKVAKVARGAAPDTAELDALCLANIARFKGRSAGVSAAPADAPRTGM